MMTTCSGEGGADDRDHMLGWMGPGAVDQQIRQAIMMCWSALPPEKKNVDAAESEIRRLVDRALRDLREDAQAFGIGS